MAQTTRRWPPTPSSPKAFLGLHLAQSHQTCLPVWVHQADVSQHWFPEALPYAEQQDETGSAAATQTAQAAGWATGHGSPNA